ncbi:MAG: hypothetical protein R2804_00740 [Cyclobacteriaceae bacterium]
MKKAVWISLIVVVGVFIAWLQYNKPHREPSSEQAITISAVQLFSDFSKDERSANLSYLNKVLAVNGKVMDVSVNVDQKSVVMLETADALFGINCTLDNNEGGIAVGDSITLVGICTGFLSDVVMVQCQLKK